MRGILPQIRNVFSCAWACDVAMTEPSRSNPARALARSVFKVPSSSGPAIIGTTATPWISWTT
jgi:hypothetical protein